MADEQQGADLLNGKIELADGIVVDDRLRLGGVLYIERKCNRPLTEVFESLTEETPRFSDMAIVLTALYLQVNKSATEEEASAIIMQIDLSKISEVLGNLKVFEFSPKNSTTPVNPANPPDAG